MFMELHIQPHYGIGYIEELMAETAKQCSKTDQVQQTKDSESLCICV